MAPTMGCCASSHMVHLQTWSPQFRTGLCHLTRQRQDDNLLMLQGRGCCASLFPLTKGAWEGNTLGAALASWKRGALWESAILPASPKPKVSYPALPICFLCQFRAFPSLIVIFSLLSCFFSLGFTYFSDFSVHSSFPGLFFPISASPHSCASQPHTLRSTNSASWFELWSPN